MATFVAKEKSRMHCRHMSMVATSAAPHKVWFLDAICYFARTAFILPIVLVALLAPVPFARGQEKEVLDRVIKGIRDSQRRLVTHAGGVSWKYSLAFHEGVRKQSPFTFREGLKGVLNVKWPIIRCRIEGLMLVTIYTGHYPSEKAVPTVREANFNFETFSGLSYDDKDLGQIINYRDAFTSDSAFPLKFMFFELADQYYDPNKAAPTDYWLPNALVQGKYETLADEYVSKTLCHVLERKGFDKLWVSAEHGFIVVKREFYYGSGKPLRERTENAELKQIAPETWIPMKQVRETFDDTNANNLIDRLTLSVSDVRIGSLSERDLEVKFPEDIMRIEDLVKGEVYEFVSEGEKVARLNRAVQKAQESVTVAVAKFGGRMSYWVLLNAAFLLALVIWWLGRPVKLPVER
jgi:hypothetical protein